MTPDHRPLPPGFLAWDSTIWPRQGNTCYDADRVADEQIAMLLEEACDCFGRWERAFPGREFPYPGCPLHNTPRPHQP